MIKYGYKKDKPYVEKVEVTYIQEPDTCQNQDEYQVIKLSSEDGGGGPFIRISIPEGNFWSVDNYESLKEIFDDFKEKLNYDNN